jgi:hypothetical protein
MEEKKIITVRDNDTLSLDDKLRKLLTKFVFRIAEQAFLDYLDREIENGRIYDAESVAISGWFNRFLYSLDGTINKAIVSAQFRMLSPVGQDLILRFLNTRLTIQVTSFGDEVDTSLIDLADAFKSKLKSYKDNGGNLELIKTDIDEINKIIKLQTVENSLN